MLVVQSRGIVIKSNVHNSAFWFNKLISLYKESLYNSNVKNFPFVKGYIPSNDLKDFVSQQLPFFSTGKNYHLLTPPQYILIFNIFYCPSYSNNINTYTFIEDLKLFPYLCTQPVCLGLPIYTELVLTHQKLLHQYLSLLSPNELIDVLFTVVFNYGTFHEETLLRCLLSIYSVTLIKSAHTHIKANNYKMWLTIQLHPLFNRVGLLLRLLYCLKLENIPTFYISSNTPVNSPITHDIARSSGGTPIDLIHILHNYTITEILNSLRDNTESQFIKHKDLWILLITQHLNQFEELSVSQSGFIVTLHTLIIENLHILCNTGNNLEYLTEYLGILNKVLLLALKLNCSKDTKTTYIIKQIEIVANRFIVLFDNHVISIPYTLFDTPGLVLNAILNIISIYISLSFYILPVNYSLNIAHIDLNILFNISRYKCSPNTNIAISLDVLTRLIENTLSKNIINQFNLKAALIVTITNKLAIFLLVVQLGAVEDFLDILYSNLGLIEPQDMPTMLTVVLANICGDRNNECSSSNECSTDSESIVTNECTEMDMLTLFCNHSKSISVNMLNLTYMQLDSRYPCILVDICVELVHLVKREIVGYSYGTLLSLCITLNYAKCNGIYRGVVEHLASLYNLVVDRILFNHYDNSLVDNSKLAVYNVRYFGKGGCDVRYSYDVLNEMRLITLSAYTIFITEVGNSFDSELIRLIYRNSMCSLPQGVTNRHDILKSIKMDNTITEQLKELDVSYISKNSINVIMSLYNEATLYYKLLTTTILYSLKDIVGQIEGYYEILRQITNKLKSNMNHCNQLKQI